MIAWLMEPSLPRQTTAVYRAVSWPSRSASDAKGHLHGPVWYDRRPASYPDAHMDDLLTRLESHITAHQLIERAKEGFHAWLAEGGALPKGWSYHELHAQLDSIHLCVHPAHVAYPYMDTKLRILRGNEQVGHYRLITKLDGTAVDDYFVLNAA